MTRADEGSEDDPASPPSYSQQSDTSPEPSQPDSHGHPSLPPLPGYTQRDRGHGVSRYSRRHHRHRRRSMFRFKRKESNIFAAVCSMIVMLLLCTAMAEPQWFYLRGGGCREISADSPSQFESIHYLGISQFFYLGRFLAHESHQAKGHSQTTVYNYGPGSTDILIDCVTPQIVSIMKSLITLGFVGIILSLLCFLADLAGPTFRPFKILRRNGVLSIIVVVISVIINGLCYWVTELLEVFQSKTKLHDGSKAVVSFSVSFYLVTAAGAMAVIAAACNLLKRHGSLSSTSPSSSSLYRDAFDSRDREHLLDDYDGMDLGMGRLAFYPPPPPYTPIPQNNV